jgi:hypothetical protein
MATKKTKIALTTFVASVGEGHDAEEHFIREGQTVASDHPAVKGREQLFADHDPAKPTSDAG